MAPSYEIADERRPSRIARLAVRPFFPLLAMMLGGSFAGWIWFTVNAFALGGSTRVREIVACVAGVVGSAALAIGLALLHMNGTLPEQAAPYSWLAITVWKMTLAYWVYEWQSRAAALREHYHMPMKNGVGVLLAVALVRSAVLTRAHELSHLLYIVME